MTLTAPDQRVREWLLARPVPELGHHAEWSQLLTVYRWLGAARGSGKYLRPIDVPGVDTKFVEARRSVLADLLGVSRQAGPFLTDLGLRTKPEYVRIRLAPSIAPICPGAERAGERARRLRRAIHYNRVGGTRSPTFRFPCWPTG